MDIKDLKNSDVIWLALFVSFMTAIVTGIVVVFLYPESIALENVLPTNQAQNMNTENQAESQTNVDPDDQHSTSSATTSSPQNNQATTTSETSSEAEGSSGEIARDTILAQSVNAVARVTATSTSPQAGVLYQADGNDRVIVPGSNGPDTAQALFEAGAVANLSRQIGSITGSGFSVYAVTQASERLSPLELAPESELPDSAYIIPQTNRPQIYVAQLDQNGKIITASGRQTPAGSMIVDARGRLLAISSATGNTYVPIRVALQE